MDRIAAEARDVETVLARPDKQILEDRHALKSLKYSIIVIAEAMAGTLQHILAKRHNKVIEGYMDAFRKSREQHVLSDGLVSRLQPFLGFRNMLVHQYWRVSDEKFLTNLRNGLKDFRHFVEEIETVLSEPDAADPDSSQGP
jgi:uncharacterized protein YutE (UPF0331/DUF86 family)